MKGFVYNLTGKGNKMDCLLSKLVFDYYLKNLFIVLPYLLLQNHIPYELDIYCTASLLEEYLVRVVLHILNEILLDKFHSITDHRHDDKFDSDHHT